MAFFFKVYTPESFLGFTTILLLLFNCFLISYNTKNKFPILNIEILIQIVTLCIITLFLFFNTTFFFNNFNFFFTGFQAQNIKFILLLLFLNILIPVWRNFIIQKLNFFEFFIILNFILLGLFFLICSYNIIAIYLCLEIQALGFYILASFNRLSIFSSEAGLKYFISSSLISGIFLFGSSLIYFSLGTLNLYEISILLIFFSLNSNTYIFILFFIGCFLILNTLLFKLVIAPFHFWFPQIYDGSPISSTIIFSVLPKIALINLFISFWSMMSSSLFYLNNFFFLIGMYSVIFGILKMLRQKKLKKLYIYSSISVFGLLLCVLIDNTIESHFSIYFFLIIYFLTTILFWSTLTLVYYNKSQQNYKKNFHFSIFLTFFTNILTQNIIFAITICFIFFSMAALPPFSGFISKLYIFIILLKNFKYEFSFILIYFGILGSYYYIKFLKIVCFENLNLTSQSQVFNLYNMPLLSIDCLLYSFLLFLLFFFFIHPQALLSFLILLF